MAEQLTSASVAAPGFFGLNTQDASTQLENGFALQAFNAVIDKSGRIGARKGWTKIHTTTPTELGTAAIEQISELIGTDGTKYVLAAGNNKLFKLVGTTLSELTYGGGGSAPTITASNWSIATLNNKTYFFQSGHDPLIFDPSLSTTAYRRVSEHPTYSGTVPQGNVVISAYGRLWVGDLQSNKQIVYFSDLAAGTVWNTGTAGSLDVSQVWTNVSDQITALAAHGGFFVIFGLRQTLIYQQPQDPNVMSLLEGVNRIGCIARDSVKNISNDLLFLSDAGVRSFARLVQEKSMPMRDISKNVRDDLLAIIPGEDLTRVRAVYNEKDAFYLLTFPLSSISYCFDVRTPLPDGAARATVWTIAPKALYSDSNRRLLMGFTGYIGEYKGYTDNEATYPFIYFTNYFDFQTPTTEKLLKKIGYTIVGGVQQPLTVKWGFDYANDYRSQLSIVGSQIVYEYGIAEYGIAEYSGGIDIDQKQVNANGRGKVLQIGFETQINGQPISIQKIDVYVKQGRLL
jgi:hypothetical protein